MIKVLQRRFALSRQGAADLIKGCITCIIQDISFMIPVGLLYMFVMDMLNGGISGNRIAFYVAGGLACLCLIFAAAYFQYNATYLATYVESGVRRISLAEQLRKIPLSFFSKKNLADLTNSIMGDCAALETAFSHYVPALAGSLISTTLISVFLFIFDWRMAVAAVWVLPVAFAITFFSSRIQEYFNQKSSAANVALEDGVQECIENLQDLKANNAEEAYLRNLNRKIDYVEKRHIITELGTALFVVSIDIRIGNRYGSSCRLGTACAGRNRNSAIFPISLSSFKTIYSAGRSFAKSRSGHFHKNKHQPYERDH